VAILCLGARPPEIRRGKKQRACRSEASLMALPLVVRQRPMRIQVTSMRRLFDGNSSDPLAADHNPPNLPLIAQNPPIRSGASFS
jgi:hypothetical protein